MIPTWPVIVPGTPTDSSKWHSRTGGSFRDSMTTEVKWALRAPCFSRVCSPKWPHRPPPLCCPLLLLTSPEKAELLGPFSSSPYPVQVLGHCFFCPQGSRRAQPACPQRAVPGECACAGPPLHVHAPFAAAPLPTLALRLLCWLCPCPRPWLKCPLLRKARVAGCLSPCLFPL